MTVPLFLMRGMAQQVVRLVVFTQSQHATFFNRCFMHLHAAKIIFSKACHIKCCPNALGSIQ